MPGKEIKHTIRLEGEREYSQAIRDAQRNLRTLRSELKAETAELGSNATAQQKNEARAKSLKAQIAEQEKVVETLKKALAEAKRDYADNEDVVQKWEQKLNEARTTLANMQNGLADAENAMRGVSGATAEGVTATQSFADALDSIASVGESVSGAIEDIFTGLIGTVRDVVVDLWDLIGDTAAKANNWTDIAGYWNTDPTEVEKWDHAVRSTSNSFSDFETIISRLALGGKEKTISEMLGISDVNYESQWDYAIACMEQISRMTKDGTLPDNFWEEVFGEKKATKAMDIINDWDDIQQNLAEFDPENGGFGINEEETAAMNQYKMDMDELMVKWEALKDSVAAGLGVIAADLLVNVSGGLDALNDYLNADTEEERQAAIQKLETNVREAFEKVAAAIEAGLEVLAQVGSDLQNSDDPIVRAIGNILTGITNALEWLVGHDKEVVAALRAIFGTWLTAKLAIIAGKLASIVADIQTIQMFKDWKISTATPVGSGEANVVGTAAGESSVVVGGQFDTMGAGLASALFVSQELFNHRIKREDIDEIADYADSLRNDNAMGLPSPKELGNRGYDIGIKDANIIGLPPVELQLDPKWMGEGSISDTMNDAMNAALNAASFAAEETVNRLMLGSNQQAPQQGLTSDDVSMFRGIPAAVERAAKAGVVAGMKSVNITLDGDKVVRYVGTGFYKMVTE